MDDLLKSLTDKVLSGEELDFDQALALYSIDDGSLSRLLPYASLITKKYRHDTVNLCAITNARSGLCPEDCAFCAQSIRHNTAIPAYPLISEDEMFKKAEEAVGAGTNRFCIVTSGRSVTGKELSVICAAIIKIKNKFPCLKMDASLGILNEGEVSQLKNSGLDRYNHNLETAESFFSSVCTTHTYGDRLKTIRQVKALGLEVCCGGIIGLGENDIQRIELAFTLRGLDVDSIPLNFLNPVAGTALAGASALSPLAILKTIVLFRFVNPSKEIRVCGGRQVNLRGLQAFIYMAGADAIIIGNYLTTKGSSPEDDIRLIKDLGLKIEDGI